ncbi:extensin-like protein:near transporter protein [Lasius niger]|uniref:Extensin-like protein:near transporter protein n=1 Tax=Lasius niger TaxID=67767 RepID=A0A0J7JYQ1_LASNI|nr:extensin-like protein:near transporter protein [Lasius niger]KMQ83160.1 extensin-like protein:near transporter protein [Lasius niger]
MKINLRKKLKIVQKKVLIIQKSLEKEVTKLLLKRIILEFRREVSKPRQKILAPLISKREITKPHLKNGIIQKPLEGEVTKPLPKGIILEFRREVSKPRQKILAPSFARREVTKPHYAIRHILIPKIQKEKVF